MQTVPMVLGTVQLGMNYGIANTSGKPDEEKSFSILRTALEGGVNTLDTARAYGDSEEVIGRFLKTWKGPMPNIVTKIPKLQGESPRELEKFVVTCVEESLQRLGVSKLSAVMLHGAKDPSIHGKACANAMEKLLTLGYTNRVGVSVYTAEDIQEMLPYDVFSVTQVPMSIFDQRLLTDGSVAALQSAGYTVYVRSVFLQGLFFLDPDTITDPILVEQAVPYIRKLRQIAAQHNMTVAQLAIAFMRDQPGVSGLVLGADTPAQVTDSLSSFHTPPLSPETLALLEKEFSTVDIPEIMKVLSKPKK